MMLLVAIHGFHAEAGSSASLVVQLGVAHDGEATGQWLAMLRKRLPESQYAGLAGMKKPLSGAEQAWADLILSKIAAWETRRAGLAAPYAPVEPPARAVIVLGNRGGDDGFTHDPTTIGFDLSMLQSAYGDAVLPENTERIDRLFDHEYTHLLQKAWLRDRPYRADSPLRAALLDIWLEGLGNHRSMSGRWRSSGGRLSQSAMETLAVLEPRFIARLAALACASPEQAPALMADLSRGNFQSKWGALPAALWLDAETGREGDALRRFVLAGPDEVWNLAARHVPDSLQSALTEARLAASLCSNR